MTTTVLGLPRAVTTTHLWSTDTHVNATPRHLPHAVD
jgi:hypothetical protein